MITIFEGIRFFRKDRADVRSIDADTDKKVSDNAIRMMEKQDKRIEELEIRLEKTETRQRVFQQAINCAFRCKAIDEPEQDCPVLLNLNKE